MIFFIPNILTEDECKHLSEQFDIERKYNPSLDYDWAGTNTSYGFEPSFVFNTYLDKLKPKVLECNPTLDDLLNVNTFVREYVNTSTLDRHIDRKDIGITMSICLESSINKEWPLCAEIEGKEYCFNTNVGDAVVLFDAHKNPHWRSPLECNDSERVIQFFLHWTTNKYTNKRTKTLL
jgi:hypothetical protein